MTHRDTDLALFADYYGFDYGRLAGADAYRIESAGFGFVGAIEAIRITEQGRFGNIFYQILHATLLARQLGCRTIVGFPFLGGPAASEVQADDMVYRFPAAGTEGPQETNILVGHFFNSYAFESALRAVSSDFVCRTIERYLKPLFVGIIEAPLLVEPRTMVVHFRSGDIFHEGAVHPWYVQPPASYYARAIAFGRNELGVSDVRLIFEDRANPTVALTESFLTAERIPFVSHSGSFAEDVAYLVRATHLVTPLSTLCEVLAMLSGTLQTYIAFRQFESHQHIHLRAEPLLLSMLRRKGIRAVLLDDAACDYIAPRSWKKSAEQLDLLRTYPGDNLQVLEGKAAVTRELKDTDVATGDELIAVRSEATRLRSLLVATQQELASKQSVPRSFRNELASLQKELEDLQRTLAELKSSTSWRMTAPLRWCVSTVERILRAR